MAKRKATPLKRTRGVIGNKSPNQRAVITTKTGQSSVKTLRALDPLTFKTLQRQAPGKTVEQFNNPAVSKNVFKQRGFPVVRKRAAVRRLFRRDPYNLLSASAPPPFNTGATVATFSPQFSELTNNPTAPFFHPEKSPGAITVKRQPQAAAGRKNRGSVTPPNRFSLFGGKTLRRR
jgi:hypothetical protein